QTATVHGVSLQGAKTVFCTGGPESDVFNLDSLTSIPTFVNGGGENPIPQDPFTVSAGGSSVSVLLSVGDMVQIDDSAAAAGTFSSVASGAFQSQGRSPMSFTNIESVLLTTTSAADTVSVVGSSAPITFVHTNGGDPVFVSGTAANSATAITGDAKGNR